MTDERKARLEKMEQEQLNWKKLEQEFKLNNKQLPKSQHYIFITDKKKNAFEDGLDSQWFEDQIFKPILDEIWVSEK